MSRFTDNCHEDNFHSHKHGGRHHHRHHPQHPQARDEHEYEDEAALYEYYGELDQKTGLKLFSDILKSLKKNGVVSLAEHQVSIADDVSFSISHEETWDETEKLTLEIEWYPEVEQDALTDHDTGDDNAEQHTIPVIN